MAASIREIDNLNDWENEWSNFEKGLDRLKAEEYVKLMEMMEEYRKAQQKFQKDVDKQMKNASAFALSLKRISKTATVGDKERLLKLTNKLNNVNRNFNEFKQALPKTAGRFLRACIGEINVSLFWNKQNYKDVYEKFKLKMMMLAFVCAIVNLVVLPSRFTDALFNGILVWYYSSLTLQEQILRANGSRIKGWYLTHHYLSILVSGFLLIWPDSVTYQLFRFQFYIFVLYLSFVQFLQYHYQSGLLYRLRALGKGDSMDITEEGFRSWMFKGLSFIVPFLLIGYGFQYYNSYTLFKLSQHPDCNEWQVLASGILFFIIATGNIATLFVVLRQKFGRNIRFPCS